MVIKQSITEADKSCEGNACEISKIKVYDRAEEVTSSPKGKPEAPAYPAPVQAKDKDIVAGAPETKSRTMRASMEKDVSSVVIKQGDNILTLRVSDIQSVAGQVEKILAEYSAAKVSKQSAEDKIVFRAEISKEKLEVFIKKIKTLGRVEDQIVAEDSAQESLLVEIAITGD